MSRHDDMDLMLYFDGELDGDAELSRSIEAQLADQAEARRKLESLGQLREVVRTHLELSTDEASDGFEGMWDRIARGANANGAARAPAPQPAAPATDRHTGMLAAIRRWLDAYRGHVLTGAVTAAAVALLALVLRPTSERVVVKTIEVPVAVKPHPQAPRQLPVRIPPSVDSLDVVDGTGTVLIEKDSDSSAAVIWVTRDDVEGPI